jgi:hypothetical protein
MPSAKICPVPTPDEPLCLFLAAVPTDTLHGVPGGLCRLGQGQAQQGLHVFLPARRVARRPLHGQAVCTGAAA